MSSGDNVFGAPPPTIWGGVHDQDIYSVIAQAAGRIQKHERAKSMNTSFTSLSSLAEELGEEQFKELAPNMYALYKEMKLISDYRKMADILEDN
ncbi:hypothetical protein HYP06_gp044 [Vibrio phage vB_VspP_pVa5]|uniref:Uncharacterized protein n=1 Tax=Vibrio phage vB_VspP_pVa5 TaxID=1913109 RepID=A0A1J0GV79_9CAUD|nr:hypothetical protein HYP06_gp044 [Vibrio phage vB_VspP_pVa5]APC46077.1 hypothetical protein vBVspPpVa5_0044 [Vibrio phage vB_VspP_pVa5]